MIRDIMDPVCLLYLLNIMNVENLNAIPKPTSVNDIIKKIIVKPNGNGVRLFAFVRMNHRTENEMIVVNVKLLCLL